MDILTANSMSISGLIVLVIAICRLWHGHFRALGQRERRAQPAHDEGLRLMRHIAQAAAMAIIITVMIVAIVKNPSKIQNK